MGTVYIDMSFTIGYGEVNVVVPIVNSSRLVVGVRAEVYLMDWSKHGDRALRLVTMLDQGLPDNILNEGKADALGRFWAGKFHFYCYYCIFLPSVI